MNAAPPRRQLLAPDARRAGIIEATIPLLAEHGPAATSAQIARAAGISQGTIFHVFADKQDLIDTAVRQVMDVEPLCAELIALAGERSLSGRLASCADIVNRHLARAMPLLTKCGVPEREDPKGHMLRKVRSAIADLLAPDAGSLTRPVDELAGTFFFLCVAAVQQTVLGGTAMPDGHDVATLFLDGARRRP
ncbi:MAG: TetR/AcrR family transcriptional regulator [Ilumatobacteraceae bacterium]